jgi:hypothetical protein
MGLKGWNVAVLVAIGLLWVCGSTQREKPVVGDLHSNRLLSAEQAAAHSPNEPETLVALAQAYLDAHQPGMAVGTIERAPAPLRQEPTVEHLYARALVEQGRSADALAAERRVLDLCAEGGGCSTWLLASATRRTEILEELGKLGVEDANAYPEASSLAYHNATRRVSLSVR